MDQEAAVVGPPFSVLAGNIAVPTPVRFSMEHHHGRPFGIKLAQRTGRLPQNVNFAISGTTARTFLDANKIAYKIGRSGACAQA